MTLDERRVLVLAVLAAGVMLMLGYPKPAGLALIIGAIVTW